MFYAILALGGSRPYEFLFSLSPLITTILAILKLDHRMEASWPEVMIPMIWFVFNIFWQPALYALWLVILSRKGLVDAFHGMYDDRGWIRPMLFRYAFYLVFNDRVNFAFFLPLISFTVFAVSIALPMGWFATHCVEGMGCDAPGIYYFIPLMIIFVGVAVAVIVALDRDTRFERIFVPPLLILATLGLIFVMLNVDGFVHWSWNVALIPFYILLGVMVVEIAISLFYMNCCHSYYRRHSVLGGEYEIFQIVLIVILVFWVIPAIVFVSISGPFFDGYLDLSYAKYFSPLLVIFSVFGIIYVFMYCLLHG